MRVTVEVKLIAFFVVAAAFTFWVKEPVNEINQSTTHDILLQNYGGFMEPTNSLPRGEGDWPEAFARALFFYTQCLGNKECTLK